MTTSSQNYISLTGRNSSLVIDCSNDAPQIMYWREKLSAQSTGQMMSTLRLRQEAPASPMKEIRRSLTPTTGQGYTGHPGLNLHGETDQWSVVTEISKIDDSVKDDKGKLSLEISKLKNVRKNITPNKVSGLFSP